jgi:hypothetical protein
MGVRKLSYARWSADRLRKLLIYSIHPPWSGSVEGRPESHVRRISKPFTVLRDMSLVKEYAAIRIALS